MKDKLFEIFTFCGQNNIEFNLENNKDGKNSVIYRPAQKKVYVVVADFEDEILDKKLANCFKKLQDSIK